MEYAMQKNIPNGGLVVYNPADFHQHPLQIIAANNADHSGILSWLHGNEIGQEVVKTNFGMVKLFGETQLHKYNEACVVDCTVTDLHLQHFQFQQGLAIAGTKAASIVAGLTSVCGMISTYQQQFRERQKANREDIDAMPSGFDRQKAEQAHDNLSAFFYKGCAMVQQGYLGSIS